MKSKFILATLVIIVFYISLELAYATMILGVPIELAIGHQLPLRGVVVASILVIGIIIYRYLSAQKSKYNLHKVTLSKLLEIAQNLPLIKLEMRAETEWR